MEGEDIKMNKKQEACGMCRVGNVKMVMNRKWTERKKEGQGKNP